MQLYKSTHDPFYKLVVDYRNVEKLKGTYVDGWAPKADGRVHSTFTFRPATHQMSSVHPNVQNTVGEKGGELGVRFKRVIEARPGRKLVSFDFTGLHAYMLGYLAKDRSYMRLAALGIHDFVAAHMLRKESKDEETLARLVDLENWLTEDDKVLAENLSWIKSKHKVFRSKVKPAVHGYGFGIGAKKLSDNFPDNFATKAEAQVVIDMLNTIFPLVAQYREDIKREAQLRGYLMTPYGAIRHFSDVYDVREVQEGHQPRFGEKLFRTKSGKLYKEGSGQDAEKAIAFLPAACSFGYKKDGMLMTAERGLDDRYCLINEVHDELLFECPDKRVDECMETMFPILQHRSRCLRDAEMAPEGLICPAAVGVGQYLSDMKELIS